VEVTGELAVLADNGAHSFEMQNFVKKNAVPMSAA
jgi:hypothetical protein